MVSLHHGTSIKFIICTVMNYSYDCCSCREMWLWQEKKNRHAPQCYFLNSLETVTLILVYDKNKICKTILAWKIKFLSTNSLAYALEIWGVWILWSHGACRFCAWALSLASLSMIHSSFHLSSSSTHSTHTMSLESYVESLLN